MPPDLMKTAAKLCVTLTIRTLASTSADAWWVPSWPRCKSCLIRSSDHLHQEHLWSVSWTQGW